MAPSKTNYYIGAILGSLMVGFGLFVALDAWATMQHIEAQGIIGQAFRQEEYQSAANSFRVSMLLAVFGFIVIIFSVTEYIAGTVKEAVRR